MPTNLGASRIDKAYVGAQEVTAMYLGTEKVYPNTTTWERWGATWSIPGSSSYPYTSLSLVYPLFKDGTQKPSATFKSISIGSVFYDEGYYYQKTQTTTAIAYPDEIPPKATKATYLDTIEDANENAYPVDGLKGDYWYTKI